jgi:hypothetical protein
MARGVGQSLLMSVVSGAAGFYIMHMGVEMITKPPIEHIGKVGQTSEYAGYGALILLLGVVLVAATGKLIAMAIEEAFFYPVAEPEEVWEDAPLALQRRLHFAVTKGYSRVALKDDAFHEMMKMPRQRHVRFVGNKGRIVVISRALSRHIISLPDEDIARFEVLADKPQSSLPESFWSPQPVRPMPAQNY